MNKTYEERLFALRAKMKSQDADGFIVPRSDEYQGEFVMPSAERLRYISGFTGSAGAALILQDKAVLFTDGRYLLQAAQETDGSLFTVVDIIKTDIGEWLAENAEAGVKIGYDPRLHTPVQISKIKTSCEDKDIQLVAVPSNPIDEIWEGRPPSANGLVQIFPDHIAGETSLEKRKKLGNALKEKDVYAAVITLPDSIAWLLNIRGHDLSCTPVALSTGILKQDGSFFWVVNKNTFEKNVLEHIGSDVEVRAPEELEAVLNAVVEDANGKAIGVDHKRSAGHFVDMLQGEGAHVADFEDPCVAPKAIKTQAEINAIHQAHVYDGAALVKCFHWLAQSIENKENINEIDVADKLGFFRSQHPAYKGVSFPAIVGYGANGAIIHYRAHEEKKADLKAEGLLLIDSGGQYADEKGGVYGTTDLTRTLSLGEPRQEMQENYTRVLKGHIAVATAKLGEGHSGADLDALARAALKEVGLDYAHSTGHGVGCYLAVHEEATSISFRETRSFKVGMLISNEPGYYKEGEYGIRLENLILAQRGSEDENVICFETIGYVPFDRRLIVKDMLSEKECAWIDAYHQKVSALLTKHLDDETKSWLERETQRL